MGRNASTTGGHANASLTHISLERPSILPRFEHINKLSEPCREAVQEGVETDDIHNECNLSRGGEERELDHTARGGPEDDLALRSTSCTAKRGGGGGEQSDTVYTWADKVDVSQHQNPPPQMREMRQFPAGRGLGSQAAIFRTGEVGGAERGREGGREGKKTVVHPTAVLAAVLLHYFATVRLTRQAIQKF